MMERFKGFPAKMQFTPLPNVFFSSILPQISDITELKVTLFVLAVIYRKRGHPRFVSYGELLESASLIRSLSQTTEAPPKALKTALKMAVERGTILRAVLNKDGKSEDIYLINAPAEREAISKIQGGEITLPDIKTGGPGYIETGEQPDIFTLYEQNIGLLTPMIAEELKEAEKLYPFGWIEDAVREAVNQNKRKWSYISAILERWSQEGRERGAHRRDSKKADPDKYIKGKYGHMVQR